MYNQDALPPKFSQSDRRCRDGLKQIRGSLQFPTIQNHYDDVPEAHKDIFNWNFDDELKVRAWDNLLMVSDWQWHILDQRYLDLVN